MNLWGGGWTAAGAMSRLLSLSDSEFVWFPVTVKEKVRATPHHADRGGPMDPAQAGTASRDTFFSVAPMHPTGISQPQATTLSLVTTYYAPSKLSPISWLNCLSYTISTTNLQDQPIEPRAIPSPAPVNLWQSVYQEWVRQSSFGPLAED